MRNGILVVILFVQCIVLSAQAKTIQEKLGYSKDTKLLIIHADDLGVSHSENEATTSAMQNGVVNSASIMVPTPWFSEIAAYAVAHPAADFGLHLTLTSEWKYYKWGPLSDKVPGLNNKEGFLYASMDSVYKSATIAEVENELRVQIEKAKAFGIDVTHFDAHMGSLYGRPDYLKLLIKLGREYKVPVMLAGTGPRNVFGLDLDSFVTDKDVFLDAIYTANPADFKSGMANYYSGVLKSMKAGLNLFIIHTAYDDKEMQSVTVDNINWGAAWRQADYNFFTSESCKKLLKEQNVRLVTWREVRDKLAR